MLGCFELEKIKEKLKTIRVIGFNKKTTAFQLSKLSQNRLLELH